MLRDSGLMACCLRGNWKYMKRHGNMPLHFYNMILVKDWLLLKKLVVLDSGIVRIGT